MAKYKVDISGINTSNLKVLTNEKNNQLFLKLKNGDPFARDDLIKGNLKLVLSIIKKFNNKVDNLDDLFQVGCLGLVKAIDNFDPSYGVTLSTYACPMISGEIKRYIRDNSSLRISRSVKDIAYKTLKLKEELMTQNGIEPKDSEVAKILGVEEYEIANALNSLREPVSMYEPIYNDGGDTILLCDQLSIKEEEYSMELKLALSKAMEHLKKRELENQDEFKARRSEFFCLKAQFLGALFRTCIESSFYAVTQEAPDEVDSEFLAKMDEYQQNFEKEKKELIELLEKISEFQEIDFDSNLKDSIVGWKFNSFDKCDSITEFEQKIAEYLQSLDIK